MLLLYKIEAREKKPDSHVTLVPVHVTLLDENDNSPTFSRNTYEGKVFANQTVGMSLVQVSRQTHLAQGSSPGRFGSVKSGSVCFLLVSSFHSGSV